jgi:hypothetical protein
MLATPLEMLQQLLRAAIPYQMHCLSALITEQMIVVACIYDCFNKLSAMALNCSSAHLQPW